MFSDRLASMRSCVQSPEPVVMRVYNAGAGEADPGGSWLASLAYPGSSMSWRETLPQKQSEVGRMASEE